MAFFVTENGDYFDISTNPEGQRVLKIKRFLKYSSSHRYCDEWVVLPLNEEPDSLGVFLLNLPDNPLIRRLALNSNGQEGYFITRETPERAIHFQSLNSLATEAPTLFGDSTTTLELLEAGEWQLENGVRLIFWPQVPAGQVVRGTLGNQLDSVLPTAAGLVRAKHPKEVPMTSTLQEVLEYAKAQRTRLNQRFVWNGKAKATKIQYAINEIEWAIKTGHNIQDQPPSMALLKDSGLINALNIQRHGLFRKIFKTTTQAERGLESLHPDFAYHL